jgi:CDGSH-type Zn-finger protein
MKTNLCVTTPAAKWLELNMLAFEEVRLEGLQQLAQHKGLDNATRSTLQALLSECHGKSKIQLADYATVDTKDGYGRLIASNGLAGLGSEDLLHALSGESVRRIQVEDAQIRALLRVAKHHKWAAPCLEELCSSDRSAVLQKIGCECLVGGETAYTMLLTVLHDSGLPVEHLDCNGLLENMECGANTWKPPLGLPAPFLTSLQKELRDLAYKVATHYPESLSKAAQLYSNNKQKIRGQPSTLTPMGLLVCSVETQMMLALAEAIHEKEWNVASMVNDSLYVWELAGDGKEPVLQLPNTLLEAGEAAILCDTCIRVKLGQRTMDPAYDTYVEGLDAAVSSKVDPFNHCTDKILAAAKKEGLIRMQDSVWEPVPGTTCGYRPYQGGITAPPVASKASDLEKLLTTLRASAPVAARQSRFKEFVNKVLVGDPVYIQKHNTHEQLVTFLEDFDHPDFPIVPEFNRALMSFRNGTYVLHLDSFIPHDDPAGAHLKGQVARNHIDADFDPSCTHTPLFDKLIGFQMETEEQREWLMVSLGRLQYQVGEMDEWQVMLYIYGLANTGKSAVYKVMLACFRPGAVACLSGNTQEKFGLEKLAQGGVELIMCMDMPANKSADCVMAQDDWQKIVSGEPCNINKKHKTGETAIIPCHLAFAGNTFLKFEDVNDNCARRALAFHYQKFLPRNSQEGDLVANIIALELPAIINRCNKLYLQKAKEFGKKCIWSVVPQYFKDVKSDAAAQVNPLVDLLRASMPQGPCKYNRYFITEAGETEFATSKQVNLALKAHMKEHSGVDFMKYKDLKSDQMGPLHEMGIEFKKDNLCKGCGQPREKPHTDGCFGKLGYTSEERWYGIRVEVIPADGRGEDTYDQF